MKYLYHSAKNRGHSNLGWLDSYHSFSFGNFFDPNKTNFGALRVLNDDTILGGTGFGTHPHKNMEIISIPLAGGLKHQDSMGNETLIQTGEIQVMSAGSGILHSEYNASTTMSAEFLQIWILPNEQNVSPRYDQITLNPEDRKNRFQQILSPNPHDEGVWIHQNAWFYWGTFETQTRIDYPLQNEENGVYIFVLSGEVEIETHKLTHRDGLGIWAVPSINMHITANTEILLIEVPL